MITISPSDLSPIEHEFAMASASELYEKVLVARFRGAHRPGAEGAPDARTIQAFTALGLTLWVPDAVVLDLSELDYPGGPMLHQAMTPVEPDLEEGFPFYVVVSDANRDAVAEALPEEALVGSLDEAISRIQEKGPWALR